MTNILSPFVKVEESFQFYMNGRVFEMDNSNEIKEIEGNKIDSKLRSAIAAFESFEFGNETIKWFHGPSKFIFNLKENNFSINESVISNSFSEHVLRSGAVRYNDVNKANLFESLPTMLENFVNLDFAAQFEGNNNIVNVFKLEENVFVARLNTANKISNFFKADNANQAVEYVNEKTGKSALAFLSELVEGQAAEIAKIEETIGQYESMISFLKDQRGLLAEADKSIEQIKAADNLISEEIKVWESKIAQLNEAVKFISFQFNSHKNHNPSADILEGHIDSDTFITYGIYVNGPKKGDEFMEYYTGENYKQGSTKKSNSRLYEPNKIPAKYKNAWEELKAKYKAEYI
jgi:hypothetical protein